MSRLKTIRGPAKAGGMCLILNKFALLMRYEKFDFKNLILTKTLVVSILKKVRRAKHFNTINYPKKMTLLIQFSGAAAPLSSEPLSQALSILLSERLSQPVLSVKLSISDLISKIRKWSKKFPKFLTFFCKVQIVAA